MPDFDISIHTAVNRDGSVDGSLRLNRVPRGYDLHRGMIALMDSVREYFDVSRVWLTVVLRYSAPEGTDSPDWRYRGLAYATTAPRLSDSRGIAKLTAAALQMVDNIRGKGRRKPETVIVTAYWNPHGEKPENRRKRPKKRKRR